ncbi:MAG TPA: HPF/RaiA family ribosome-associated protein [Bacteriovoracaceae bacterium]|nr:HPF/RaiA family ribosome-associated protein [Bacteriovoracaceae bacterium]
MQMQVYYQGIDVSPALDQFMAEKLKKLKRFLDASAPVGIYLRQDAKEIFSLSLNVHAFHKDFSFHAKSANVYEGFAQALDKAQRVLAEEKRQLKDKINRRFRPLKDMDIEQAVS